MNKFLRPLADELDKKGIKYKEINTGLFDQIDIIDTTMDVIWFTANLKNNFEPDREDENGVYELGYIPKGKTDIEIKRFNNVNDLVREIIKLKKRGI